MATPFDDAFGEDTSPEARAVLLRVLRALPPSRKLALLGAANASTRELARAGLRRRHPGASPAELEDRLRRLLLGPELAEKVYGPPAL